MVCAQRDRGAAVGDGGEGRGGEARGMHARRNRGALDGETEHYAGDAGNERGAIFDVVIERALNRKWGDRIPAFKHILKKTASSQQPEFFLWFWAISPKTIIISSLMKPPIDSARCTAFLYILKYLIPDYGRPGTSIGPVCGPQARHWDAPSP